ncbi:hypothetical protein JCM19037_1416 [Geomicrobium sp. JCM 19037]|uniref:hypothetical protein n=1 Tax=Geomicrobium sp. JCM 19037 TaxID=1460634 RepID=UPI00045F1F76|nr:hypothetical protein [Geomicrobium sp. JCM 19037]GAK03123.1 hypothetical protein JCM19037_1416 [Geomicrobium sp. JCM 19037]
MPVARRFAGTTVDVNEEVVAKITSFGHSMDIEEADITGSEDLVEGGLIYRQQFIATAVGETVSLEGISIQGDKGQSELKTTAEQGRQAELTHTDASGRGHKLTGFFTSYEEEGSVSDGIYNFSGEFRVNSKEEIDPGNGEGGEG